MSAQPSDDADALLSQCALNSAKTLFAPGLYDKEITLYRQQVRAFNLAFLLHESRKTQTETLNVGVIGAGACGLTLSAALMGLGHKVTLFERQADGLYLQRGCETRYIHPSSYDWPAYRSDIPFAELPFLTWRAASASSVARQIADQFEEIAALSPDFLFRGRTLLQINAEDLSVDWQAMTKSKPSPPGQQLAGTDRFDRIILCVGFGIESDVDDDTRYSYWRNDPFNQVRADSYAASRSEYWVSGAGDAGLIDVQRLVIRDYDQRRFVFNVWGNDSVVGTPLGRDLRLFRAEVLASVNSSSASDALFEEIERRRNSDVVSRLDCFIDDRKRTDTFVVLNSEPKRFRDTLAPGKQSFLNALVVQRLYSMGRFVYHGDPMTDNLSHDMRTRHHPKSKVVVRHGASRLKHLELCWPDAKKELDNSGAASRQPQHASQRLWPVGWWQRHLLDVYRPLIPGTRTDRVEFCSSDIEMVFDGYVNGLSALIANFQTPGATGSYRVCLHRVLKVQDQYFYQQITRYSGTNSSGLVGRVFDLASGIVGLAYATSKTVIVDLGDNHSAAGLWAELNLSRDQAGGMRAPPEASRIYIAVPIRVENCEVEGERQTGFVLYLDSSINLFSTSATGSSREGRTTALELIRNAFSPFSASLSRMQIGRRVFFNSVAPYPKNALRTDAEALIVKYAELTVDDLVLDMPSGVSTEGNLNRYQDTKRNA